MKRAKKFISYVLIAVGIISVVYANNFVITGSAIGEFQKPFFNLFGLVFILVGIILNFTEAAQRIQGIESLLTAVRPGKGIKGDYVPLREFLEKGELISNRVKVEVRGDSIYRDGRIVQGAKIDGDYVEFTGYHFTNREAARFIEQDYAFTRRNFMDPFVYFVEPMDFSGLTESQIRHLLGAASAEELVSAKIRYPIDKVYMKFERGRPTHYALEGEVNYENLMERRGSRIKKGRVA